MILLSSLVISDIGRWVEYQPSHGPSEKGRIKAFNAKWIFVVYKCANDWERYKEYTGAATRPEDLNFIEEFEL